MDPGAHSGSRRFSRQLPRPFNKEKPIMRGSLRAGLGALVLGAFVWACAGNPGPGDPGYPFNLSGLYGGQIFVEGMAFSFEIDVQTRPGGEFGGTYAVTSPVSMTGDVAGTLVADTARFSLDYVNPMDGCGGTLDGTGTVTGDGEQFAGRVRVNDTCNGYLSGTFSTRKRTR
jgi:hypothetical protein